jgi:hypothetical protein
MNNMVLQTIAWEDKCDFHRETGGIWLPSMKDAGQPGAPEFCHRNNISLEQLDG